MRRARIVFLVRILFLVLMSGGLGGCAASPGVGELPFRQLEPLPADYQALQGTWLVLRNEVRNTDIPQMAGATFHFKQNRHWFRMKGETATRISNTDAAEQFLLDSTVVPHRIDFDDGRPPRIQAIYKIEGDRLMICSAGPGKPRPTEFRTSFLRDTVLVTLQRVSVDP